MKRIIFALLLSFSSASYAADKTPEQIKKQLNATYQQALKDLASEPEQLEKLKQNQSDWQKYASGYCSLTDGHPMQEQLQSCYIPLVKQRIQQLDDTKCEEGLMDSYCIR
jgi:uncharacterized protein YecT (DUF1311 family)